MYPGSSGEDDRKLVTISFLRRLDKKHVQGGVVDPEAFKCDPDGTGPSIHLRSTPLDTPEGVKDYQNKYRRESGDLFGVCEISKNKIPATCPAIHMPEDSEIFPFGNLHYELTPCPDEDAKKSIAFSAIILLNYVRATKGSQ